MPTRRKNVDLNRLKRSCKRSKVFELLSLSYVQYLLISIIWGVLFVVNQSTDMRFEYFWPVWLSVCSIHDSLKFQGLQYTIVFIIILITIDLMCFFLIPVSWIYTFGSAYVWLYFFRHTDQGLCFFTLSLCFVFIYFEFSLYSKATKSTHSIYVFRPFAAHSIGYSVVCVGFSLKRYLDISYRDFKRMNVRRQNYLHFRILYEALPLSSVNDNAYVQHSLDYFQKDSLEIHEVAMSDDFSSDFSSRSVFIPFRFGQLCFGRLVRWFFGYLRSVDKQYLDFDSRTARFNHSSTTIVNGVISNTCVVDAGLRRAVQCLESSPSGSQISRRYTTENSVNLYSNSKPSVNGCVPKQSSSGKPVRERGAKEDPVTRLESNVRRLRSELQSMRGLETQLRNQLNSLQHDDHLNRLSLSNQRQENEGISSRISKLTNKCRTERVNLNTIEQNLGEEVRLRQLVEAQLTEIGVIPVRSFVGSNNVNNVPSNSTEKCIPTSMSLIQASSNNDSSSNSNVVILQPSESEKIMDNYCCRLRQLLESKIYALRLTVKYRENLTLASKMHHSGQLVSKCLTNANLKVVDTSNYDSSVHQYDSQSLSCRLQSGQFITKDVYCCILNSDVENLHNVAMINQHSSTNNHRHAFLENCFNLANEKRERLANKLRTENWQKQELLTLYHTSVREITELNKTLKQRDLQILELTMKIEQLECLPKSTSRCDPVSHAGYFATTATLTESSSDSVDDPTKFCLGEKQFTSNKQQDMSSLLPTCNIGQLFTNTSTNTRGNILIHSASTSRFCAPAIPSITSFTDFASYPEIYAHATYHYKDKQNLIFTKPITTTFHTNLSSSCLLTSRICSSSSSSSSSSNMSCAMHADVQTLKNYKESSVITSVNSSCPIVHQQHHRK
ncbi:unnamed protein product [Schistosoma bovis]|nr:unnamed protein product [Schistosoma bovis]CAH8647959.1 unnamed protein product [Schistosoma bovis]